MVIKKEVKIGFIATITLLVVFWGFNFLKGKDIFRLTNEYIVLYKNVNGLLESNPVLISGYKVGLVKSIEFDLKNPELLRVTISIAHGIKIPYGTKAKISSLDLMGSKGIELNVGKSNQLYHDFDTLPGIEEIPFYEKIDPLQQKAENILESVDTIVTSVKLLLNREMIIELRNAISNIKDLTGNIANQNANINSSLENLSAITLNIKNNNDKLNNILSNIVDISDTIKNIEITKTVKNINYSVEQAGLILENINKGVGSVGKLAQDDSLYFEVMKTTNKLNQLVDDIKEHPYKYVRISVFGNKSTEKK